jgi:SAM-dependent methyltransferase
VTTPTLRDFYNQRYAQVSVDHRSEFHPDVRREIDGVLAALGPGSRRVLDFGCNVGTATRLFAEAGHHVVGVDIAESVVAVARERVPSARFEVIESEAKLPFAEASFEFCFASEVIEHLFDVRGFLREVHRVLVPGGTFLVTTPYHGLVKNLVIALLYFESHFSPTGTHIRFFSRRSLARCLRAAGFEVERSRAVGRFFPLSRLLVVRAWRR